MKKTYILIIAALLLEMLVLVAYPACTYPADDRPTLMYFRSAK